MAITIFLCINIFGTLHPCKAHNDFRRVITYTLTKDKMNSKGLYRINDYSTDFKLLKAFDHVSFPIIKYYCGKLSLTKSTEEWTCVGPWCGDIISLVISPYFQSDSTLFAGTHGAIYKSTDCGKHWVRSCNGIQENGCCRLAIAKGAAGTFVLFASTWEGNLYRSDNGGETWYPCTDSLPDNRISAIAPSPNFVTDSLLFIGTGGWAYQGSVYRSLDGGKSWENIGAPLEGKHITAICISPNFDEDSVIFVGTEYNGVYGSFDGGNTWIQLNNGLDELSINQIAISPNFKTDSIVFLTECDYDEAVYRSQNGGRSWDKVLVAFASDVVISPDFSQDKEVFVGSYDQGLYKSTDGGTTWTNLGGPYFNVWEIAISPNYVTDSTLFTGHGNAGGIFYSSDRGYTWESRSNGISALEVASIGVSPNFEQFPVIFSSADYLAGPFRTTDGGNTWETVNIGLFNTRGFSFSPSPEMFSDSTIFFAVWYDGVYRSVNLGDSWTLCVDGFPPVGSRYVNEVCCSPAYPEDSIVFACLLDSTARRSYNGANSWELCPGGYYVTDNEDIVFSPTFRDDSTIFMTKYPTILVMSTDGGNSWQRRDYGLSGYLYEIAISPDFPNDSTLIAINWSGAVFRSTNAGLSWEQIFMYPDFVYSVQFSPFFVTDHTVFLGGKKGIYISKDGGENWQPWNEGFNAPPFVIELACSYGEDGTFYVFAGTYGEGVWIRKCVVNSVKERQSDEKNKRQLLLCIYPNLFVDMARLKMTSTYNVFIYDICGRKTRNLKKKTFGKELKPGICFLRIQDSKIIKIIKLQ